MKFQAYIAGPFFTPEHRDLIDDIRACCKITDITACSPKDEMMFDKDKPDPDGILKWNAERIVTSDLVIALTNGRDVGTMFECGFAYARKIPILYVWTDREEGQKFNIMLAASGVGVCYEMRDLCDILIEFKETGKVRAFVSGEME